MIRKPEEIFPDNGMYARLIFPIIYENDLFHTKEQRSADIYVWICMSQEYFDVLGTQN